MPELIKNGNQTIAERILAGEVVDTDLRTDQRVLSRITDGIYRQPSSALRELVANAYDADATMVVIQTDAPRFSEIRVRDNGVGMNVEALTDLIHSIGGSRKRTRAGANLGITNPDDPTLSPKGRKLIGKIGIGLFSVAHLSRAFRIITKRAGDSYRLIADVILHFHLDEDIQQVEESDGKFQAGTVRFWQVPSDDVDGHGTEVVIRDVVPKVRDELRSKARWARVLSPEEDSNAHPPIYHVGTVDSVTYETIEASAKLPWTIDDTPEDKFKKLVDAVIDTYKQLRRIPRLDEILDNYLKTMWELSLSIPLDYVEKHPFDISGADEVRIYEISNSTSGQTTEINLKPDETIRQRLNMQAPWRLPGDSFKVFMDGIELFRPQPLLRMPKTSQAIPHPLIFVGKYADDFEQVDKNFSGGGLEFEGYLLWTHVVIPKENNGVLIRVHEASGTLFDVSFLQHQSGEVTRASQTTAEIFVHRGLESALNIDRESFNFTHPHFQVITKWLHNAMRQEFNRQKQLQNQYTKERKQTTQAQQLTQIEVAGEKILADAYKRYGTKPDTVSFVVDEKPEEPDIGPDTIVFEVKTEKQNPIQVQRKMLLMKILAAYGLLDMLEPEEVERLYRDIEELFAHEA